MLPAATVDEYLRDGAPATSDDPPERLVDVDADGAIVPPDDPEQRAVAKQYRRRLRDYAVLLDDLEEVRTELFAREQAIESDLDKLAAALQGAQQINEYREQELAMWRDDLANVKREKAALDRHVAALKSRVARAEQLLQATLAENARLATARLNRRGALTPIGSGALDIDAL